MVVLTEALILQKTKLENLDAVKNLNLWGSDLTEVSLLSRLRNLEVLALSVNHVASLKDVGDCRTLKELYLRKNDVASLAEVYQLRNLPQLNVLWLCDNPCAAHPLYRRFTIKCCPALRQFDNVEVSPQERAVAEQMTQVEVNEILARAAPRGPSAGGSSSNAAPAAGRRAPDELAGGGAPPPQPSGAIPSQLRMQPPAAPVVSRQTQKAMMTAIVTLANELTTESLDVIYTEIGERLRQRRGGNNNN